MPPPTVLESCDLVMRAGMLSFPDDSHLILVMGSYSVFVKVTKRPHMTHPHLHAPFASRRARLWRLGLMRWLERAGLGRCVAT